MTSLRINNKDFVAEEIGLQKSNAFVKFIRKIGCAPSPGRFQTVFPSGVRVNGHCGHDPFRPCFLAETSLISWTFRPINMDISANKYGRFGQKNYYYYIAAEMFLLAAVIVTNVSRYP